MRFLFIAPRYHTNQVPIMEGLVRQGHDVMFISHFVGNTEEHSCVNPIIIGYSCLSPKDIKKGFPPALKLFKEIKNYKADIAILRERSMYTIFAYLICKLLKIPSILYNQSPLWEDKIKNDFAHRFVRCLTPKIRITPVYGTTEKGKVKEPNAHFVPFVMPPMISPKQKKYISDGVIRILSVGKYLDRKNHLMLLKIIANKEVHLTIVGECCTKEHKDYYDKAKKYIQEHQLADKVNLMKNLNRTQIFQEYQKADLFIIPSTLEPASISQLEAMANSLPIICSDQNGTACYVEEGVNGYLFKDNIKSSLEETLDLFINDPRLIEKMGIESYRLVKEKYSFWNYYGNVISLAHKIM
ncbi:MAG: glycosyltransferase family 4 protein [Lachnospiraceae bacterium]|nr:glycosyltransferase family 4 protein [Lachnospiraceae bacterium]